MYPAGELAVLRQLLFHFLEIHDQLVDENAFLKMTLYHKLVIAESYFLWKVHNNKK